MPSPLTHLDAATCRSTDLAHHANFAWSSLRPLLPEFYLSELPGLRARADLVAALVEVELSWRARMPGRVEACDVWRRLREYRLACAGAHREAEPALLFGRYRRVRLLGQGGCGSVILAEEVNTGRDVALKRIHGTADARDDTAARVLLESLEREKEALRQLQDLSVAQLLDYFCAPEDEASGQGPVLVQSFVPGPTLADFLAIEGPPYAVPDCLRVAIDVAEILRVVHNRGRLHRDIKPSNIGFDARGLPVLIDFGISRSLTPDPLVPTTTNQSATAAYAPPEWLKGEGSRDPAGEVYCLAATLYHLMTRRIPFPEAPSIVAQFQSKMDGPPPPSQLRDDVPPALDRVLARALAPLPEDRHPSMGTFADDLRQTLAEPPAPSAPRRRRVAPLLGLAVTAAALIGGAAWLLNTGRPPVAPTEVALAIGNHLTAREPTDALACRFLRLDHRHNDPAVRTEELAEVRQAVRDLLGHLAGQPVEVAELAGTQSTVLFLDLRRLRWKPAHWDLLVDHYPYGVYHGNLPVDAPLNEAVRSAHQRTGARVFAVRADWFLAAVTSEPLGPVYAKLARLDPATPWPATARRVRERYAGEALTLDQMAREVHADARRLREVIEAGELGDRKTFEAVLNGGVLERRAWEGSREDLHPPFFAAVEACRTGEAIRPPPK